MKAYDPKHLDGAPEGWQALDAKGKGFEGKKFTIQISPDDCTNCRACFNICPAIRKGKEKTSGDKALKMKPMELLSATKKSPSGITSTPSLGPIGIS
jgi:pyruvate-ferredoxin/flavodoxin oxidoreductase